MNRAKPEYIKAFNILLPMLAYTLGSTDKLSLSTDIVNWDCLVTLAEAHSVAGMLYPAINALPDALKPDSEHESRLKELYHELMVMDLNRQLETETILSALSSEGVRVLPLKGYILRNDYPVPSMRTMSDVDILYDTEKSREVKKVFQGFGYTLEQSVDGDLNFRKPPFHHYELHANLIPFDRYGYKYFENFFDKVIFPDNSSVGYLSADDFYIYMLEHLAKHMENGGAGIRMFMDVFVFLCAHSTELDREYLGKELDKLNLRSFAEKTERLSSVWFSGDEAPEYTEVADFILCSCTYGIAENSYTQSTIRAAAKRQGRDSAMLRILGRVFPSFGFICRHFPICKKHRILYPFCIVAYWFRRVFVNRNISTRNKAYLLNSADSEYALYTADVMKKIGLDNRI